MSRERFIDPGIWTSAQVCAVDPMARLLFIGMITTADDEGRGGASLMRLKASIFPMDAIELTSIHAWREALVQSGLVRLYSVGGQEVYDLPSWRKWQRVKYVRVSSIPAYGAQSAEPSPSPVANQQSGRNPAESGGIRRNPRKGVEGCGGVGCGGDGSGKATTTSKALAARAPTPEPDADAIPPELARFTEFHKDLRLIVRWTELRNSWADACPSIDIPSELARAHSYAIKKRAEGFPYRNFVRYLTSWMFRQQDRAAKGSASRRGQVPFNQFTDDTKPRWRDEK